jgi:hypothetical protein
MDDRSWIYRDLSQILRRMDYCNGIQGFINDTISHLRNTSGCNTRYPCKRCKNKRCIDPYVVTMHLLQKEFMEKYMYWYAHGESYVPHDTTVERMIGSTFSASNVYGVVEDNSNPSLRKDCSRID